MTMFRRIFSNSLPARAWLVVGIVAFLAVGTASTSAIIAWIAKADAKAINSAGMMRMATYRMNYLLAADGTPIQLDNTLTLQANRPVMEQLIDDMQRRLDELHAYQDSRQNRQNDIDHQVTTLTALWHNQLKPAIRRADNAAAYRYSIEYINQVDKLTNGIQKRNEQRQHFQQMLQLSALTLIIIMMMIGMYELKYKVLQPISALMRSTRKFKQTGLPSDIQITGYREFLALGESFNSMTHTISEHQHQLQTQVMLKTAHLLQINQVLTLLYNFANTLNHTPVTMPKLHALLVDFTQIVPQLQLSLCVHGEQKTINSHSKDRVILHTHTDQLQDPPVKICTQQSCSDCHLKNAQVTTFEIHSQQTHWGDLLVSFDATADTPDFVVYEELIFTLVHLLGVAFNTQKQRQQEHQLLLLEERNTIARELHDSIAQSLSYLKIQLSIIGKNSQNIQQALSNAAICCTHKQTLDTQHAQLDQVLGQARSELNAAYTQLRELLVTFRLKINAQSFDAALQQACDEFSLKDNLQITLNNRVLSLNMTASEQIDVLQITREALTNIHKHAKASRVTIELFQDSDQWVHLQICDDGIGLQGDFDQTHHHGLNIMQERASSLGGSFSVQNHSLGGVQIAVAFLPKFFQTQA